MAKMMLGKAGKMALERHMSQYTPRDPLYEAYTDHQGRQHRRRRGLPPGLSERDQQILKSVQKRAHYLDKGFSICGAHFGWTFIIGIIPGAGDVADAALNYILVVRKCRQADLPAWLVRKMLVNNVLSAVLGFIPIVGDILLAVFKANSRNALLLEEFLAIRGEEYIKLEVEKRKKPIATPGPSKQTAAEQGQVEEVLTEKEIVEIVKPGSGLKPGEVIPSQEPAAKERTVASTSQAQPQSSNGGSRKRSLLGTLRRRKEPSSDKSQ